MSVTSSDLPLWITFAFVLLTIKGCVLDSADALADLV